MPADSPCRPHILLRFVVSALVSTGELRLILMWANLNSRSSRSSRLRHVPLSTRSRYREGNLDHGELTSLLC